MACVPAALLQQQPSRHLRFNPPSLPPTPAVISYITNDTALQGLMAIPAVIGQLVQVGALLRVQSWCFGPALLAPLEARRCFAPGCCFGPLLHVQRRCLGPQAA